MIRLPLSALTFAGSDWLLPALIAGALALLAITWTYLRSVGPTRIRLLGALLKTLAAIALIACLLEPTWSGQRIKPGANILAVIADDSASMQVKGEGEREPRNELLRKLTNPTEAGWLTKLSAQFDVKRYLAGTSLQSTADFTAATFQQPTSNFGQALATLRERYHGQPLAGIVLLTDGVATDIPDVKAAAEGLPPIFPVLIGSKAPGHDLAVQNITATQTAFEDAPVTIQVEVSARGYASREVSGTVRLSGKTENAAEQTLKPSRDDEKLVFRFQVRPAETGVLFYEFNVAAKGATPEEEPVTANNRAMVTVDRGGEPQRILYVSGRPNWEYKFLQRAVQADPQTQLVALIRIAKREPKFDFRGRSGESSNPLFRGFGNQSPEEIARYDQPVLMRLNTEDENELRTGFPKTAEDLYRYRAVIIDDLEAEFFTPDQMSLLQRFVSERGGSVLMLGGAESFVDGNYNRTAIGEMLPIYLDRKAERVTAERGEVHWQLSRDGWLQPWARLRSNEAEENQRVQGMPGFDVVNAASTIKPAASVVASISNGNRETPALVTQRFGRGRTAALLVGDLWQSGLGDEARQADLGKQWRQMVRWLVADVPLPFTATAEPVPGSADVRLQVQVRDRKFDPVDNAAVNLEVTPVGSTDPSATIKLAADPSPTTPGLYEATYVPRADGGYGVMATATDDAGVSLGRTKTGWSTQTTAKEFRSLEPDRTLMDTLASATGGKVITPDALDSFADELPSRPAPLTETWSRPLWHTPLVFLFAIGCLVAEWGVRRWKGLP